METPDFPCRFRFEFSPSWKDWEDFVPPRSRVFAAAVWFSRFLALWLVWEIYWNDGVGWKFAAITLMSVTLWIPDRVKGRALMSVAGCPHLVLLVTDDGITVRAASRRSGGVEWEHTSRWESAVQLRAALEGPTCFHFEGGRRNILIPKRVFSSSAQLAEFRELVAEKMQQRCRFAQPEG